MLNDLFSMNTLIHTIGVINLRHTTTDTTIIITWDPVDSPSGCESVFYYTVTVVNLANNNVRNPITVWRPKAEFSDLINGTEYTISVAAVNRAGSGPSSTINVTGNIGMYLL